MALTVAQLGLTPGALAQPKPTPAKVEEARSRYERGRQLYDDGAFDAALIEFQRAYELAPSYKILFNLAQVHRQRNDYASALRTFERYLKEGGAEVDAKRRAEVDKELAQLRSRVATLVFTTNVSGVEISIDDELVGKTPLPQGVMVNSGKRKVTASRDGRVPVSRVVNVAGAETLKVDLELLEPGAGAPAGSDSAAPPPPPTAVAPPPPASIPWVGWAVTGLLGVGWAVTGGMALSASSSLSTARDRPDPSRRDLDDQSSKAKNLALVSDILLGATVVAGGVSLYLTLRTPKADSALVRGPVRIGVGPSSVKLDVGF
ncbi:MAG: PEGA domain-containing protein [Myxococcales bacterium]|nr:MAG: PEGA domain-containing protein [Myxococcales bacterium]